MMKKVYLLILFSLLIGLAGCNNNPVIKPDSQNILLYEKQGLLDSLVGTCSAYLIRTIPLDTIDLSSYNNINFTFNAFTDGDLSGVSIYHVKSDTAVNLFNLNGIAEINNTNSITVPSPKIRDKFYVRLKLFASQCTGQNYHLKLRDLNSYGN